VSHSIKGKKILVIDDHHNIRTSLKLSLESEGCTVKEAGSVQDGLLALGKLAEDTPLDYDVVFLDIRMPDGSGMDILAQLAKFKLAGRVVVISGEGSVSDAFKATQFGAFDYIEKPFTPERIMVSATRCIELNSEKQTNKILRSQVKQNDIIGEHASIQAVKKMISKVAPTNGRVLIHGESGTGKELVAESIHRLSTRATKPLIKVNCAAIPHSLIESELFGHVKGAFTGANKDRRGLFEQAHGGTLFLDEIGELNLEVQAKLLRTLQSGEVVAVGSEKVKVVDVRVLAATHRDLEGMCEQGEFREDLFFRLNVVGISVPPLRERASDIKALSATLLKQACKEHGVGSRQLSDTALKTLETHSWPGNIRELKNTLEREAILSETNTIEEVQLSSKKSKNKPQVSNGDGFGYGCSEVLSWQAFHQEVDKEYIKYVLSETKGNVSEASRMLCLERAYLHRLMKKLGVQRDIVVQS